MFQRWPQWILQSPKTIKYYTKLASSEIVKYWMFCFFDVVFHKKMQISFKKEVLEASSLVVYFFGSYKSQKCSETIQKLRKLQKLENLVFEAILRQVFLNSFDFFFKKHTGELVLIHKPAKFPLKWWNKRRKVWNGVIWAVSGYFKYLIRSMGGNYKVSPYMCHCTLQEIKKVV